MARTRRLRTLLALWAAYWAGLAAVEAGPARWEFLRLQATSGRGSVSWEFSGSATMLSLALFGPPLLLWALWLLVPERDHGRRAARSATFDAEETMRPLHGAPFPGVPAEHDARMRLPVDEEPPRG